MVPTRSGLAGLRKQPKSVLLKLAIELEPEVVAEKYSEGWTEEDILRVIEQHLRDSIGNSRTPGWQYVQDMDIIDAELE